MNPYHDDWSKITRDIVAKISVAVYSIFTIGHPNGKYTYNRKLPGDRFRTAAMMLLEDHKPRQEYLKIMAARHSR